MFFNYSDYFPNQPLPPYFYDCEIYQFDSTKLSSPGNIPYDGFDALKNNIRQKRLILYLSNEPIFDMVKPYCGDCRTIGVNTIPSFWE